VKRRLFLASSLSALGLAGCGPVKDSLTNGPFRTVLEWPEHWNHAVIGTHGLVRTYREADIDRDFRIDSLDTPSDSVYQGYLNDHFRSYKLIVDGKVERKESYTLAELRAMSTAPQITRHDCVEGWSAIGKWRGVPLSTVLAAARPTSDARYVVFHCMDRDQSGSIYYESLDLHEATHPQTLLALDLNDAPIQPDHGAPVRLKVPQQLGYKSAKWVQRIELVATLPGKGGYWEDQGYEWYAGI
jgi:hypothetical protein